MTSASPWLRSATHGHTQLVLAAVLGIATVVVLIVAAGPLFFSRVNDAGFWLVEE